MQVDLDSNKKHLKCEAYCTTVPFIRMERTHEIAALDSHNKLCAKRYRVMESDIGRNEKRNYVTVRTDENTNCRKKAL